MMIVIILSMYGHFVHNVHIPYSPGMNECPRNVEVPLAARCGADLLHGLDRIIHYQ